MVVYEITSITEESFSTQDTLSVPVGVSYAIPGPLGAATVVGSFAPISTVFVASSAAPEPRFLDSFVETPAFSIGACEPGVPGLIGLVEDLGAPGGR